MEYTTPLPVITVVTVVYNDVLHIEDTILSIINQTYPKLEYIVIDGGSTDGTVDVIRKYESRISYWVTESDKGIYDAMNKGIRKASGEWCCFLNSGDLFVYKNILSSIFDNKSYDCGVLYGDTIHIFKTGRFIHKSENVDILNIRMPFCHQSCLVKTDLLKRKEFNCHYRIAADYDLFYRLYKEGVKFCQLNMEIAVFENIEGLSTLHPELLLQEYSQINGRSIFCSLLKLKIRKIVKFIMKCFPYRVQHFIDKMYKDRMTDYKKLDN